MLAQLVSIHQTFRFKMKLGKEKHGKTSKRKEKKIEKPLRTNNMYLSYFAQSLVKSLLCTDITKLRQIIYLEAKIKIIISKQHKNLNCLLTLCDQNGFVQQPIWGDVIYQCQNFILNTKNIGKRLFVHILAQEIVR